MLNVKVVRKRQTNYPAVFKAINARFLPTAGVEVQREAVRLAPIDLGGLKGSIKFKVDIAKSQVRVGTNLEYAPYQEFGTVKMKAQPYLRPALDHNRKFLVKLWAEIYNKAFRVLGGK